MQSLFRIRTRSVRTRTVKWVKNWLAHAKIPDGPVFRRSIGADQIGGALNPRSIEPIFKRVAQ
jgi:hypothetical protein